MPGRAPRSMAVVRWPASAHSFETRGWAATIPSACCVGSAGAQDAACWQAAVTRETQGQQRTFTARCVTAEAEQPIHEVGFGDAPDRPQAPGLLPLPTAPQAAAIALAGNGADFTTEFLQMAGTGTFTVDQVLDEAAATAASCGLLALREAQHAGHPRGLAAPSSGDGTERRDGAAPSLLRGIWREVNEAVHRCGVTRPHGGY
ncbi:hypothetical protein [Streptomyces sp. YIM 121038]|uniref:hypothetical protein n=1 Tax=Streptomyces sp. YIM 121038 TaxID=2136401 RepID=UPI0011106ABD|nr:hypothetical protein [Streptomyces sp. YIM 121038]